VRVEDRAAFGRDDAEFIDYPLPVPVLSTPAYVRPLDAAPREGAKTDFDLLFLLCSNGCSKNLVEALRIDRRVLSIEAWSNGYHGVQEDEDEKTTRAVMIDPAKCFGPPTQHIQRPRATR
jgi:hypothetical protein